jgi:hypothetical protein
MIRRSTACALLALTASVPTLAQQAGLSVSVVSRDGSIPQPGLVVRLENPDIGYREEARSDARGQARFAALATGGRYVVRVLGADGAMLATGELPTLRNNHVQSITLGVAPGAGDAPLETVTVAAPRAVTALNQVNAEVSATLRAEELARLPLEGRDVLRALVRLPNVVPSTGFFPEAPAVSINGANGLFVNYLIDGLDNNENFLGGQKFPVPVGATRDVTVLANSFSAEFGRTANGVVNVSSRSGTNEFEGEVFLLSRPGRPPDAATPFLQRDLSGNFVGDSFGRWQGGFAVGGPIVRDRSFFFANVEYTRDRFDTVLDAPALGVREPVRGDNLALLATLRLDQQFGERWRGTLRANLGSVSIERAGGGFGGGNSTFPSAGSEQDRDSLLLAASLAYTGEAWSSQTSLLRSSFDWDYGRARQAGPQVVAREPSGLVAAVVGHPGFVFDDRERTWQLKQRFERAFGEHRLSFGADWLRAEFELLGGGNVDGNYTVDLTAAQLATLRARNPGTGLGARDILALDPRVASYAVELRPRAFGRPQNLSAAYVEDEWRISPRLTVTLGLRWDYDSLTAEGSGDGDRDNLAPRLALNFRPDERTVWRAGAGLFYDKLTYAVISDALQRNTTSAAFRAQLGELVARGLLPAGTDLGRVTFDGNLTVSPACASASACPPPAAVQALRETAIVNEARILNPDGYRSPRALQLSAGWQRQIDERWSLGVDLIHNRSRDLVRLRDLNAPASFVPDAAALTPAVVAELRALPSDAARIARASQLGLVRAQAVADASRPVALRPGGARQITVSETAGAAEY